VPMQEVPVLLTQGLATVRAQQTAVRIRRALQWLVYLEGHRNRRR
jgi:hypothetical protein